MHEFLLCIIVVSSHVRVAMHGLKNLCSVLFSSYFFAIELVCMHVFYFIVSYILCSLQQFVNVVFVLLCNHSTIVFGGYCKLPLADFFFFWTDGS